MGEYDHDVKSKLGGEAWDLLLLEVKKYRIEASHMLGVARLLGDDVKGKHQRRKDVQHALPDEVEWKKVLSDWWSLKENPLEDMDRSTALDKLRKIFSDDTVELHPLSRRLKAIMEKPDVLKPCLILDQKNILPASAILPASMTPVTAVLPKVDKQIGPTCASHAVGKAVQMILHENKIDADQEKIVTALKKTHIDGSIIARNPDTFKDKEIIVDEKSGKKRKLKVKIIINTTLHKFEPSSADQDFSRPIVPFFTETQYKTYKENIDRTGSCVSMVLRWNLGKSGNHAIYAERYDPAQQIFSCINSWGQTECPNPDIHETRIYAIDFVQCSVEDITV